ncbi:MAG: energy transducer TonB [Nitrospirota bacterium]
MDIKRFFFLSIAVHSIVIFIAFSLVTAVKENKGGEFFARLVSPDELPSTEKSSRSVIKTPPALPAIPKRPAPLYAPPKSFLPHAPVEKEGLHEYYSPGPQSASPQSPPSETGQRSNGKEVPQRSSKLEPSLREKLFDKNIISELLRKEDDEERKKEKAITFNTKEYKFFLYNKRLRERIENIWIYPSDAASRGIYGDLYIRFTIKKNGRLGAVELIRTSGHKSLDDAALKALRDAEPFWPLPHEWNMEAYTIEGHFIYTIYGYYIR